jgi:hypothetical protein
MVGLAEESEKGEDKTIKEHKSLPLKEARAQNNLRC